MTTRWRSHRSFEAEFKAIAKRQRDLDESFEAAKKLLGVQFDESDPRQVIAPAKIHRLCVSDVYELWKIEVAVKHLRPSQFPRVWFSLQPNLISFLAIRSHVDNYSDDSVQRQAADRFNELMKETQ